jgi:hypothetical protein
MDEAMGDETGESLEVRYAPDTDGTGKLYVAAATCGFAGESSAWFDTIGLIEFAEALSAYPLAEGTPVEIHGGFRANEEMGRPVQEHVGLSVEPVGGRGQIRVRIHLATPVWPNEAVTVPHHDVRLVFLTSYERLRYFSDHMVLTIRGQLTEAALGSDVLS